MSNIIHEDAHCTITFAQNPLTQGHLLLEPKQKISSFEECDTQLCVYLCEMANSVAGILFEELQAHGTNILIRDGKESHTNTLIIEIIARFENDGLSYQWSPKQLSQDDFIDSAKHISDAIIIGDAPKPSTSTKNETVTTKEEVSKDAIFYQELNRLP